MLKSDKKFEVVASTTQPETVLDLLAQHQPDVVITDIEMGQINGIELSRRIRLIYPKLPILALSMYGDKGHVSKALEAGISGYILKNTGYDELVQALSRLVDGHLFFSDAVSLEMMKSYAEPKAEPEPEPEFKLTSRELEIVKLIAKELSNAQIGEQLFISERTVETHRKNIFRKTNTKTVVGLIRYAYAQNII